MLLVILSQAKDLLLLNAYDSRSFAWLRMTVVNLLTDLFAHPDFRRFGALRGADDVGRDQDQQLVVLFLFGTLRREVAETRDSGEHRQTAQTLLIGHGNHSRHHRRFPFLEQDSPFVLTVGNDWNAIDAGGSQRAELYLQFERHVGIAVNQRLRLERESDVLIIDGRKGRGERLIPDDLRDRRIVINRSEAGVEDGITRSQLKSGVLLLGSAQGT